MNTIDVVRRLHSAGAMMIRASAVLLASSLLACTDTPQESPADLSAPPPDFATVPVDLSLPSRDPADHPDLLVMKSGGGPVMQHVEMWTVVWQGDEALGARVNQFVEWMLHSDYWKSTAEYGVGEGTAMGVLVIPSKAPATLDDGAIEGLLKANIASGNFPMPDGKTEFAFILNSKTTSTMFGSKGCSDYEGYHSEARLSTGNVPYLINLQCGGPGGGGSFDNLTEVLSHETSEACTDPYPYSAQGWMADNQPLGGEISDLCAGLSNRYGTTTDDPDGGTDSLTYLVTRNWSNAAAKSGTSDPCVPVISGHAYFNVAVSPTNIVADTSLADDSGNTAVDAEFQPYAVGEVGTIKWSLAYSPDPGIAISPSSGSGHAGDTLPVTITIGPGVQRGVYPIYLITESSHGGGNQWVSSITVE